MSDTKTNRIKKYTTYLTIGIVVTFLFIRNGESGFFKSGVDFFEENGTESVPKKSAGSKDNLIPIKQIQSKLQNHTENLQVNHQDVNSNSKILLFLNSTCQFNRQAIKEFIKFNDNRPSWKSRIYVIGSPENFKRFIIKHQEFVKENIEIEHDVISKYSKKYKITKSPTFILSVNNEDYKISGQPDLSNLVKELL